MTTRRKFGRVELTIYEDGTVDIYPMRLQSASHLFAVIAGLRAAYSALVPKDEQEPQSDAATRTAHRDG